MLETDRNGTGLPVDLAGVEALGWVADEEKIAHLGAAEIVCAPSLAAESFGIVLAEAMAAGVPVVASDLPGYRAVLRDGQAGRLTPPGDPVALADALYDLLQDEEERRRLAAAGSAAAAGALLESHHRQHRSRPTRTRWRRRGCAACTACRAGRGSAARCSTTHSGPCSSGYSARRAQDRDGSG